MTVSEQIIVPAVGFEVRVQPAREVVRVKAIGELDLATGPQLHGRVAELVAVGFEHVIVDLRGLSFIDASGVRLLVTLADRARGAGWRLSLIPGDDRVQRVLALTGTLDRLPFCGTARRSWMSHDERGRAAVHSCDEGAPAHPTGGGQSSGDPGPALRAGIDPREMRLVRRDREPRPGSA